MAQKLHVDIETFSSVDIKVSGAYKYTESIDFEILLIAYAIDDQDIKIIDLASGDSIPQEFLDALLDPNVEKHAHNANFERQSFKQYGWDIPIEQWHCSAVRAAYCGLPISLELVSKALKLEEKGKLSTGKTLIRLFCNPCKPTKVNGGRLRNLPEHFPDKWEEFKLYCINDVEAERQIDNILADYPIPEFERINYIIDQYINDRGIEIDMTMAQHAVDIDNAFTEEVTLRMKELTGLDNPNSPSQLKDWLSNAIGENVKTLAKDSVVSLLKEVEDGGYSDQFDHSDLRSDVAEVIDGRLKLAKSSTKKYVAMLNCACYDNRAHGLFQFYGANRTGRWAGRLIQLQNLPQNHMKDLELARGIVASGDYDLIKIMYDNIPNVLSELIRTTFVAPKGKTFSIADFSAIEARVLSWVAAEEWRLDVFKTHGKIYEASAAMRVGVPIESVTKGSDLRQRGKTAELALGYQGADGALEKMDRNNEIPPHERSTIVKKWRKANPKIVQLWDDVEKSAIRAIRSKKSVRLGCLGFHCDDKVFRLELPSGRCLFYNNPLLGVNRFGRESITFMGMDQVIKQWIRIETYGGKLVENIVQAISRDLLAYSMQRLEEEGFKLVMHVHDEVIAEVNENEAENELNKMCEIMGEEVPWAKGLPLKADGYFTSFYKKD